MQGSTLLARRRRRAAERDHPADRGRVRVPQRLPDLADLRRHQLAGALDAAVRAVDRQPAALQPARRQRPVHPQRRVQAGRLAHGRRRPVRHRHWPQGTSFYHYDQLYNADNVGYPARSSATRRCPTSTPCRRSSGSSSRPATPPVMAEIDLVSSHTPWAPLPTMVPLGPGRRRLDLRPACPRRSRRPPGLAATRATVQAVYGQSIQYSLSLAGLVRADVCTTRTWCWSCSATTSRPPSSAASNADHDVPISIVAHDPAVLGPIAGWGWQRACCRARRRRCGRWTPSATGSSTRTAATRTAQCRRE